MCSDSRRRGHTKRAPFGDLVFGHQTIHKLPELVEKARVKKRRRLILIFQARRFIKSACGGNVAASLMCQLWRVVVNIVPFVIRTRGEEFSRPLKDVVREIYNLASRGSKEIILLGQMLMLINQRTIKEE